MNNTPKLRFSEFSGEWNNKKLGNLGTFFKGSGLSKAHLSEEGKPCVLYGELYTRYGEVIKNVVSRTDFEDAKLVIGQVNDVLIPSSGESAIDIATASCLQQDEVILGGDLNVFRSDEVNGVFVSYQLNNSKRNEIAKLAQGASVVHVYNNQLSKLKLSVPCREEQDKIASFFSLIDKKIELQTEKVESLKEYKKGMMQKMFPKNGENVPELRFEGFTDAWEQRKLGDEVQFFSGLTYSPDNVIPNRGTFVLRSSNVKNGEIVDADNVYVDSSIANSANVQIGDIVVVVRNGSRSLIGKHAQVKLEMNNTVIGAFMTGIRSETSCFTNAMLDTQQFNIEINKNLGATINQITTGAFKEMRFFMPSNKLERDKIGECFYKLDETITLHQRKLDELNKYKKGLLQQMFV